MQTRSMAAPPQDLAYLSGPGCRGFGEPYCIENGKLCALVAKRKAWAPWTPNDSYNGHFALDYEHGRSEQYKRLRHLCAEATYHEALPSPVCVQCQDPLRHGQECVMLCWAFPRRSGIRLHPVLKGTQGPAAAASRPGPADVAVVVNFMKQRQIARVEGANATSYAPLTDYGVAAAYAGGDDADESDDGSSAASDDPPEPDQPGDIETDDVDSDYASPAAARRPAKIRRQNSKRGRTCYSIRLKLHDKRATKRMRVHYIGFSKNRSRYAVDENTWRNHSGLKKLVPDAFNVSGVSYKTFPVPEGIQPGEFERILFHRRCRRTNDWKKYVRGSAWCMDPFGEEHREVGAEYVFRAEEDVKYTGADAGKPFGAGD